MLVDLQIAFDLRITFFFSKKEIINESFFSNLKVFEVSEAMTILQKSPWIQKLLKAKKELSKYMIGKLRHG